MDKQKCHHICLMTACFFKSTKEARHTRLLQIQIESTVSDHHISNLKLPANQTLFFCFSFSVNKKRRKNKSKENTTDTKGKWVWMHVSILTNC